MSQNFLWTLLVVLAAVVGVFHGTLKSSLDREQVEQIESFIQRAGTWEGRYPPDFRLELLSEGDFQLSDRIGQQVIVLNFFATWCAPCREEMPELERFYQRQRDEPFLLLGVDVEESRAEVEAFIDELGVSFPVVLDRRGEVAASFQVESYPTTILIGVDGRVHLYEAGAILNADVAFADLLTAQRRLLDAGQAVSREEYLAGLAAQPELELETPDAPPLTGRALEIAETMPCPCGCEQKVLECGCSTADKIMTKLDRMELDGRTDVEVMQELNREFCVGATG